MKKTFMRLTVLALLLVVVQGAWAQTGVSTEQALKEAIDGGGILNHGTLTLEGGTITDCYAQNCGGGIFNAPASAARILTLRWRVESVR